MNGPLAWILMAMLAAVPLSSAHGAIIYGNLSGLTVDFLSIQEDSGTDIPPLYGPPTVSSDTLNFEPTAGFSSNSPANGQTADTTDGLLRFTVRAKPGYVITSITITEFGDFSLLAAPGGFAAATIQGTLFGTDTLTGITTSITYVGQRDDPPTNQPSPFTVTGFGSLQDAWTAQAALNYQTSRPTEVEIDLNNTLQTVVVPSATAFIAKKDVAVTVTTVAVPEPASLALLGLGGLVMFSAHRRRRRA